MRTISALLLIAALQSGGTMLAAQRPDGTVLPATDISAATIAATLAEEKATKVTDIQIRTVNAGGHHVGVGLVHRPKGTGGGSASHEKVSEVYHILEGVGTLVTGGVHVNPRRRDGPPFTPAEIARYTGINGPGASGDSIKGGVSRVVRKGDVVIIPAGTPHWWSDTAEDVTYTVVRIDPTGSVTLK